MIRACALVIFFIGMNIGWSSKRKRPGLFAFFFSRSHDTHHPPEPGCQAKLSNHGLPGGPEKLLSACSVFGYH
jgi:hypothetical protein